MVNLLHRHHEALNLIFKRGVGANSHAMNCAAFVKYSRLHTTSHTAHHTAHHTPHITQHTATTCSTDTEHPDMSATHDATAIRAMIQTNKHRVDLILNSIALWHGVQSCMPSAVGLMSACFTCCVAYRSCGLSSMSLFCIGLAGFLKR